MDLIGTPRNTLLHSLIISTSGLRLLLLVIKLLAVLLDLCDVRMAKSFSKKYGNKG